METTTTEKPKKGLSGFATFEFAISLMMLVALVAPLGLATMSFMGTENTKMFFYFSLHDANSPITFYLPFILPIINIVVKNYYRTSWLSLLTIYAAYIPIMAIDGAGGDMWVQVKPTFGYYLQWVNIFLMAGSVLISWIIFWGKKCTNYKRLFAISGIMIVGGIAVGIALIKLLNAAVLGGIFFSFNFLGIPLLIVAIISFFINHKKVEKIPELDENAGTQISSTSSSWFNKKTGMIVGGILTLAFIGLTVCLFNEEQVEESDYPQMYVVVQEDTKLYVDYASKRYLTKGEDAFILQKGVVARNVVKNDKSEIVSETPLYKIQFKDVTRNYEAELYIEFAKAILCKAFPIPEKYLYTRLDGNYKKIEKGNSDSERIKIIGRISKGKYKNTWLMLEDIDSDYDIITSLYIGHKEGEVIVFDRWIQADSLRFDKYDNSSKIRIENDGEYTHITLALKETDDFNDWTKSEIEELMKYSEEIKEKQWIKCLGYLGDELRHWYPEVTYDCWR